MPLPVAADLTQEDFRGSPSPLYYQRHVLSNEIAEESADHDTGSSSLYDSPITHNNIMSNMGTDDATSSNADLSSAPGPSSSSRDCTTSMSNDESKPYGIPDPFDPKKVLDNAHFMDEHKIQHQRHASPAMTPRRVMSARHHHHCDPRMVSNEHLL
ncbi:hypothetical protein L484_016744 [Morus notabilis]|uniref:Uncharacterized protein n=1 Tax=Morus notabilis TaxID=981085 RepID=W9QVV6_9ROSA|nr:hypothetical protein L484_016744 [Morus notabilis]